MPGARVPPPLAAHAPPSSFPAAPARAGAQAPPGRFRFRPDVPSPSGPPPPGPAGAAPRPARSGEGEAAAAEGRGEPGGERGGGRERGEARPRLRGSGGGGDGYTGEAAPEAAAGPGAGPSQRGALRRGPSALRPHRGVCRGGEGAARAPGAVGSAGAVREATGLPRVPAAGAAGDLQGRARVGGGRASLACGSGAAPGPEPRRDFGCGFEAAKLKSSFLLPEGSGFCGWEHQVLTALGSNIKTVSACIYIFINIYIYLKSHVGVISPPGSLWTPCACPGAPRVLGALVAAFPTEAERRVCSPSIPSLVLLCRSLLDHRS